MGGLDSKIKLEDKAVKSPCLPSVFSRKNISMKRQRHSPFYSLLCAQPWKQSPPHRGPVHIGMVGTVQSFCFLLISYKSQLTSIPGVCLHTNLATMHARTNHWSPLVKRPEKNPLMCISPGLWELLFIPLNCEETERINNSPMKADKRPTGT